MRTYLDCSGLDSCFGKAISGDRNKTHRLVEYAAALCCLLAMAAFLALLVWMLLYVREKLEDNEKIRLQYAEELEYF